MVMEDRINQLPDELLGVIISFIGVKQAVQTSILSTRWRCIWWILYSLSDLHFNFRGRVKLSTCQRQRMTQFVDRFFAQRNTNIRKFHLSVESGIGGSGALVAQCVRYAIIHGVQVLHLEGLSGHALMSFSRARKLRELKVTHDFENSSSCGRVTLPELEKLILHWSRVLRVAVICAKLRDVEIISVNKKALQRVRIEAPRLTSFRYEGSIPPLEHFSVHFPVLEEAHLNFHLRSTMINDKTNTSKFMSFLPKFGNAKIVSLSLDIVKALEADCGAIEQSSSSPFPNMTCLKLMKGKKKTTEVLRQVMDYLTEGCLCGDSLVVELPQGVSIVEDRLMIKTCKFNVFKICRV